MIINDNQSLNNFPTTTGGQPLFSEGTPDGVPFWKNVFAVRGLLFTGRYSSWDLVGMGYTETEVKAAAKLNEKYYLRKFSEGCCLVCVG